MRKAEKVKTKFQSRIPIILNPGKKIPKKIVKNSKNYKTSSYLYFQLKLDKIGRKKENKILVPKSVHTRPEHENSEKNSKKIQQIIKPLPGIIFSQNGMRQAEKVKTKFQSRIPIILDSGMKIPKKIIKNSTNYKTSSRDYFQPKRDEISRKRENKILARNSIHTRPEQENSEKNSKII